MKRSILIVDDSKLARMAIGRALMAIQPDWTRIEAANADEAIAVAQASAIDVALLDFNMPGRDGLTLASELIAIRPGMPIAVVSANYQDEIVQGTTGLGATFLVKPVTDATLRAFVTTAIAALEGRP